MKKTMRYALVVMLSVALFWAGLLIGSRRVGAFFLNALEHEVVGSLFSSVETLATMRIGETEAALRHLEGRVQNAVISLPQQRAWDEIPESTRTALVLAKTYLKRYPPQDAYGGLTAALAAIPDEPLDPESHSPAVRRLLALPAD